MNPDYQDMLSALSEEGAEFLVIGAYALAAHGNPRATADIDIWVKPSPDNAERVYRALQRFGAPMEQITLGDLSTEDIVFQIGIKPRRIDILTSASGIEFDEAWIDRLAVTVGEVEVFVLRIRPEITKASLGLGRYRGNAEDRSAHRRRCALKV